MAQSVPFLQALNMLFSSGYLITPDGKTITPNFGNYLDCVAGETPVFMTIGTTEWDLHAFSSMQNPALTIDDDGYMNFVDTQGRWLRFKLITRSAAGPSYWWPHGTTDDNEP